MSIRHPKSDDDAKHLTMLAGSQLVAAFCDRAGLRARVLRFWSALRYAQKASTWHR